MCDVRWISWHFHLLHLYLCPRNIIRPYFWYVQITLKEIWIANQAKSTTKRKKERKKKKKKSKAYFYIECSLYQFFYSLRFVIIPSFISVKWLLSVYPLLTFFFTVCEMFGDRNSWPGWWMLCTVPTLTLCGVLFPMRSKLQVLSSLNYVHCIALCDILWCLLPNNYLFYPRYECYIFDFLSS